MIGEEVLPLTSLRCLDLSSNQLTVVPPVIAQLVSLESLKLAKNLIHIIPTNLIVLTNLQDLDVSGNPLISPPPDVVSKGTSAIMKHLELTSNIIGASVNQFSHLHRQPYISDWIKPIADSLAISRSRPKTLFTVRLLSFLFLMTLFYSFSLLLSTYTLLLCEKKERTLFLFGLKKKNFRETLN